MERRDLEAIVRANAKALALSIEEEHLPGVLLNMERLAEQMALVEGFALETAEEPATVFRP